MIAVEFVVDDFPRFLRRFPVDFDPIVCASKSDFDFSFGSNSSFRKSWYSCSFSSCSKDVLFVSNDKMAYPGLALIVLLLPKSSTDLMKFCWGEFPRWRARACSLSDFLSWGVGMILSIIRCSRVGGNLNSQEGMYALRPAT